MFMGKLFGKGRECGFTLIELLVVILIVGILAAVAGPLYIGYAKDAKIAEAKALAGSVWTALQAIAQQNCGVAQPLNLAYSRAGLDATGATTPVRWDVNPDAATTTLTSACANGSYTFAGGPMTITGTATDVSALRVKLDWVATATPPAVLTCSVDGGTTFVPC